MQVTHTPIFRTAALPTSALRQGATLALLGATFFTASAPSFGQSAPPDRPALENSLPAQDPVIARVDNVLIRQSDLRLADEDVEKRLPSSPDKQADEEAIRREYLITYLIDLTLLSKAAEARNVGDQAEIKHRMEYTREKTLMDTLLSKTAEAAVTDEALHKAFEQVAAKNPPQPELHIRYMLFKFANPNDKDEVQKAEDRAKAVIELLKKGEDFEALARKRGEDLVGQMTGGDLGYLTRAQMGKEYAEVAFTLPKGGFSPPIKTQFGWHVIKIEDERISAPLQFEAMRDRLATAEARNAQFQLLSKLRASANIERLDQTASSPTPAEPGK